MTKNEKLLKEFVEYCSLNPEQRFWQALRNWTGAQAICIESGDDASGKDYWDTFHYENKTN